ncbi:hypothetical protein A8B78_02610 [Jannaschia sp. EhC01]|nr:hypothetical protein A8B78_02610 [Jannaschia sp. EhC01]
MILHNLMLSGGISHPFDQTSPRIAAHLGSLGIESEILSVREGLARLDTARFDMLTINALAFTMTQHEKYAPQRATYAFAINEAEKAAIRTHLDRGGKLLGLHTAAICFDDWPEWRDLLGIAWQWGVSHHPPPCPMRVHAEPPFDTVDELYCNMTLASGAQVLATATCDGVDDPQPILVHHGNAAYLALGHDAAAVGSPGYLRLLTQAARSLTDARKRSA